MLNKKPCNVEIPHEFHWRDTTDWTYHVYCTGWPAQNLVDRVVALYHEGFVKNEIWAILNYREINVTGEPTWAKLETIQDIIETRA